MALSPFACLTSKCYSRGVPRSVCYAALWVYKENKKNDLRTVNSDLLKRDGQKNPSPSFGKGCDAYASRRRTIIKITASIISNKIMPLPFMAVSLWGVGREYKMRHHGDDA